MEYNQVDSDLKYLNLGCGYRFDSQWTNVDFVATGKNVIARDLNLGIPFPDQTFELVYHSHILEHFTRNSAAYFLQECCRVLQPGGILRVVVPDLEQIARLYLKSLEKADSSAQWAANYEWMVLELLDQMVRNHPGGEMAKYLTRKKVCNRDFVVQRFGGEVSRCNQASGRNRRWDYVAKRVKELNAVLQKLTPKFLNRFGKALSIGYYRQSGEVHQWMYDRYSLSTLLQHCGLEDIVQRTATDSYLDNWSSFNLDTESDGSIYKPDSLFIEAIKPAND